MSRGAISHYSSRNLDACTLQLDSWNPFLSPPPDPPLNRSCPSPRQEFSDLPPQNRLLDCRIPEFDARNSGFAPSVVDGLAKRSSFKQIMKRSLGSERLWWSCQDLAARLGAQSWILGTCEQDVEMATDSGSAVPQVLEIYGVSERSAEENGNSCQKAPSSMVVLPPSLSGWSKKHKQLSRALARGLWRRRECSRASKRGRKCGSSRSCSSRSSDSRRSGHASWMYASDPTTVGASPAYATCSDIPIPATDSSGELSFIGEGSWDPDSSCGEGVAQKRECIAWLATDTQSLESGYGSEPGYRGDGELGYEDDDGFPDEPDEEEKEPLHLSPWRDSVTETMTSSGKAETISEPEILDEDCVDYLTSSSGLKMQPRLRRRRQEGKLCNGQKSRHL